MSLMRLHDGVKATFKEVNFMLIRHIWLIATLIYFFLFVFAVWPGWMNGDSGTQWVEAKGIFVVSDLHSSYLSILWSYLFPAKFIQEIPFLIQSTSFFVGTILTINWIEKRSQFSAALFFFLITMTPLIWNVAWVTKDGFLVSVLMFSTGVTLFILDRPRIYPGLFFCAFLFGSASIGRSYMSAVYVIWFFCLLKLFSAKRLTNSKVVQLLVVAVLVVIALNQYNQKVIKPYIGFGYTSPFILDLARAECSKREIQATTPRTGFIPRSSIVNPNESDICRHYSRDFIDPLIWSPPERVYVKFPTNQDEADIFIRSWRKEFPDIWPVLVSERLKMAFRFLVDNNNQEIPADLKSTLTSGKIGNVSTDVAKWGGLNPSQGGLLLSALSLPVIGLSNFLGWLIPSGVWLILLPVLIGMRLNRRSFTFKDVALKYLFISTGVLWLINFVLVSPALVTRYMSPGVLFGIVSSITIFAQAERDSNLGFSKK